MDFMRSAADGSQNSMSGMELRLQKKILSARMTRRSERTAASLFCAETLRRREPSSSTRPARKKCSTPSDSEEECLDAVLKHKVQKGDAVFIRYEGPKGSGMPEMFYTSEAISSDKELGKSLERASRLSPTAVFPAPPPARLSATAVPKL